ncbi:MAG TPA: CheR family methyltransferase [Herpetosiphonaceae bacterium]
MSDSAPPVQLVVVGASAGGIEALLTLVATLPPEFPAPIVIAQHLDPTRPSHLGAILARRALLPVITVQDHAPLHAGTIYVVPANRHVEITDHDMTVLPDGPKRPKPSVDLLLSSAAEIFGEQLIAVILTGTGSDGAIGARAVKQAGGTVVIQNPATAAYPGMPLSLAPQTVDIVADLLRIGQILQDLLTDIAVPSHPEQEPELQAFLEQVRARSGIDFRAYKAATIQRRLQRRLVATNCADLASYAAYLANYPDEYGRLVSTFLIKVTEFMRDRDFFDLLRTEILPNLVTASRARNHELRIWSAGCATGEEAYSLAILVCEVLGEELGQFSIKIFATDLDADAIAFARRGVYPAAALTGLSDQLIDRYFSRSSGGYAVKKQVRSLVVFGEHDLGQRAPFPRIDLVLCRNVLIYFTTTLQMRALQLFAFALREGGYLVLGKTETVSPLSEFFTLQHPQYKIYRRHGEQLIDPPVTSGGTALTPQRTDQRQRTARQLFQTQQDLRHSRAAQENLLLTLPVGVVVVDQRYDIQVINSAARRLLGIHTSAIGEDFVHLAQHVPHHPLRAAIDRAMRDTVATTLDEVEIPQVVTGEPQFLQIACYAQAPADESAPRSALVLVTDITEAVQARQEVEQARIRQAALAAQLEQTVADLERANADLARRNDELQQSNAAQEQARRAAEEVAARHAQQITELSARHAQQMEHVVASNRVLLTANEDLARMHAEMHAIHDEVLLSNEDAQAALEEVETLNEEMQATNEELETLNEELQATIEELNTSNADLAARGDELHDLTVSLERQHQQSERERAHLAAILASMADAVLVTTADGEAVVTNAAYTELFSDKAVILADEAGQPLLPDATPQARAAQGETFAITFTFTMANGHRRWCEAIGQPVRGPDDQQWGVVVIRDITERSLRRMQEEFLALANHEFHAPLAVLKGYLHLLIKDLSVDPGHDRPLHYAAALQTEVDRMTRLVNDLRDVTRLHSGKFSLEVAPVQLKTLVQQTVEIGRILLPRLMIALHADDEQVCISGDAQRLQQVLLNLFINASTHAAGSTRIDVRLRRVDGMAELVVQDDGAGIATEHLADLFSRFYQVSHSRYAGQGLGLGLYICQQIVLAHGGTIAVASVEDEGTTFTIQIPCSLA